MRQMSRSVFLCVIVMTLAGQAKAQKAMTWDEVRAKFEANNPTLGAGQLSVEEAKASEITAYLRPNPQWSVNYDQSGKHQFRQRFFRIHSDDGSQLPARTAA